MKEYKKAVFERQRLPAVVRDAHLVQCSFVNCANDPDPRPLVERVILERTALKTKGLYSVVCREVKVDTCKNTALFTLNNGLYDRVELVGDFGDWMFRSAPHLLSDEAKKYEAGFYRDVEWALDIRKARFKSLTLRGVPVEKVRRDPERHVALRKDRLLADRAWEQWDVGLAAVLEASLDRPDEPAILAVKDLSDRAESDKQALARLRSAGFAE